MTGPTRGRPNPARVTSWRCPVCAWSAVLYGVERRRAHRWSRRYLVHVDCQPDPTRVAAALVVGRHALVTAVALFAGSSVAESAGWLPWPAGACTGVATGLCLLVAFVVLRRWPT